MNISLPLSWQYHFKTESFKIIKVRKDLVWIATGKVKSFSCIKNKIAEKHLSAFLIRGCNKSHFDDIKDITIHKFLTGNEALLRTSFPHFNKKSLRELILRGEKRLRFKEIIFSEETSDLISEFLRETRHAEKPQLQNLFLTEADSLQRIFVVIDYNENWQGLISISCNSDKKVHTELLSKNKKAPQGTMEFLIKSVFDKLKSEGIEFISLGEVPFYNLHNTRLTFLENLFLLSGRIINFAYNSKGLYNFKKKFNPFWNETYMISSKKLNIFDLWYLMKSTNLLNLIRDQIKTRFLKTVSS